MNILLLLCIMIYWDTLYCYTPISHNTFNLLFFPRFKCKKKPGFSDCSQILGSNVWLCGCFSWPAHVPRTCKHGICPPNALPQHWLAPQLGGSSRVGTGSLLSRQDTRASSLPAPGPAPRTPGSCLTWIISQTKRFFLQTTTTSKPEGMMQHLSDETFK